jgi:hypothetical protein
VVWTRLNALRIKLEALKVVRVRVKVGWRIDGCPIGLFDCNDSGFCQHIQPHPMQLPARHPAGKELPIKSKRQT